jgi:prepilin-type N-terminal cleavage/methylation domain-containing protein
VKSTHTTRPEAPLQAGFTLIELLIAIFLLALGLTFVFSLFPVGLYCTRDNVDDTRAAVLAQSALARIRAARVFDRFDTAALAVLARSGDNQVCALRTPQDGFVANDLRDDTTAQYCWLATYARPSVTETGTDTSPFDALRVRVAVVRTGPSLGIDRLLAASPDFAGRVVLTAGDPLARVVQEPSARDGFVPGGHVCDMRSGCWYRIQDLKDTDGNGTVDNATLDRAAEYTSDGRTFDNALFVPGVVTVFDAMVSRSGSP